MLYHQRPSAAVCQVPAAGWELSETVLPRAAISASLTVHEPDVFQLLYADGADYAVPGEGDRWRYNYLRGFFTTRWQALDDLGEYSQTSAGSYSFTATKDITINIVFMPTIR